MPVDLTEDDDAPAARAAPPPSTPPDRTSRPDPVPDSGERLDDLLGRFFDAAQDRPSQQQHRAREPPVAYPPAPAAAAPPPARAPPPPPQRAAAAVALDDDDSDLEILDAPPEAAKGPEQVLHDDVDGDGDLVVVGSSGLVASNMPHPRHACTTHRFRESKARRTVAENARRCDHCWCFVCEVRAAECPQWSSNDVQKPAHCNAYPKAGFWADEKAARGFGAGAARAVTL